MLTQTRKPTLLQDAPTSSFLILETLVSVRGNVCNDAGWDKRVAKNGTTVSPGFISGSKLAPELEESQRWCLRLSLHCSSLSSTRSGRSSDHKVVYGLRLSSQVRVIRPPCRISNVSSISPSDGSPIRPGRAYNEASPDSCCPSILHFTSAPGSIEWQNPFEEYVCVSSSSSELRSFLRPLSVRPARRFSAGLTTGSRFRVDKLTIAIGCKHSALEPHSYRVRARSALFA